MIFETTKIQNLLLSQVKILSSLLSRPSTARNWIMSFRSRYIQEWIRDRRTNRNPKSRSFGGKSWLGLAVEWLPLFFYSFFPSMKTNSNKNKVYVINKVERLFL